MRHLDVALVQWAPSGQQLATGGNDNLLHVWDVAMLSNSTYLHRIDQVPSRPVLESDAVTTTVTNPSACPAESCPGT